MEFQKFKMRNPFWTLASGFITSFRTTFIFGASQSEFSIKSYDHLKKFYPKF